MIGNMITPSRWRSLRDIRKMIEAVEKITDERKLRLFTVAICRRVECFYSDDRVRVVADIAERFADGQSTHEELAAHRQQVKAILDAIEAPLREGVLLHPTAESSAISAVYYATAPVLRAIGVVNDVELAIRKARTQRSKKDKTSHPKATAELQFQCELLRDVLGYPFSAVAVAPNWRTSTVIGLAQSMYESRDFSPMPILADALEEAGCDNPDVLNHCRGDAPHVRGCWVVDLVLGKT